MEGVWMQILTNLRLFALVFIALLTVGSQLFGKKKQESEELDHFEKDANGLYPWEVHTDDSPDAIPKNAPRFVEQNKIRRGKW